MTEEKSYRLQALATESKQFAEQLRFLQDLAHTIPSRSETMKRQYPNMSDAAIWNRMQDELQKCARTADTCYKMLQGTIQSLGGSLPDLDIKAEVEELTKNLSKPGKA